MRWAAAYATAAGAVGVREMEVDLPRPGWPIPAAGWQGVEDRLRAIMGDATVLLALTPVGPGAVRDRGVL